MGPQSQSGAAVDRSVAGKIDGDLAGRSWDGLWGNALCFVLTGITTSLFERHWRVMWFAALIFFVLSGLRLCVLLCREQIAKHGRGVWRRLAVGIVICNGTAWGILSAFLCWMDGYHDSEVMVLLLYLSAVGAAGASFLVHNARLIELYIGLLYGPAVLVQLCSQRAGSLGSSLAFVFYSAFLVIHGRRMHREYLTRIVDNQTLSRIAKHDFLTGLPNRFSLVQLLESGIEKASRQGEKLALLYLDLNGFKGINDRLSHRVGDLFLCAVARRMEKSAGSNAVVGRLGGDEFLIFLSGVTGKGEIERRAVEILDSLHRPFQVEAHSLRGGASMGISLYPDHGLAPDELVRNADRAMYVAKRSGGSRCVFADEVDLFGETPLGVTLVQLSTTLTGAEIPVGSTGASG